MNLKLVSLVALVGSFAMACGDSGTDTAAGGNDPAGGNNSEGGGGSTGVLAGPGGGDPVGAGPAGGAPPEAPDCYDGSTAGFFEPGTFSGVTINQGVCDAPQIAGALTECFDPGTMTTCEAYNTANPECSACIFGTAESGNPIPVFLSGTAFTYLTLYACQAFASGMPECAFDYQTLNFCASTACESCPQTGTEKAECINYALNDPEICGALPLAPACEVLFMAEELPVECTGGQETFETIYPVVADYYCGTL